MSCLLCLCQVLQITFRQSTNNEKVLMEAFGMMLACAFELQEYSLHHKVAPCKFASMLVATDSGYIARIMQELQHEWNTILSMEKSKEGSEILHKQCKFVLAQSYRELMTAAEQSNFALTDALKAHISSWYPTMGSSANLESVFGDMESAVKRSGRSDTGSISGLMCVGIRGLSHRMDNDPEAGKPLKLEEGDFDSKEIPALKSKIWAPNSAPN